jgi:hypothetical protein
MGDPLSAAGSIVAFVALAGQALQGVKFLHGFFSDVKDAPGDVEILKAELKLIGAILQVVTCRPDDAQHCPALIESVHYCKSWIDKLENLVQSCEPKSDKITARIWSQLSVTLRAKTLAKYIKGLERAKHAELSR